MKNKTSVILLFFAILSATSIASAVPNVPPGGTNNQLVGLLSSENQIFPINKNTDLNCRNPVIAKWEASTCLLPAVNLEIGGVVLSQLTNIERILSANVGQTVELTGGYANARTFVVYNASIESDGVVSLRSDTALVDATLATRDHAPLSCNAIDAGENPEGEWICQTFGSRDSCNRTHYCCWGRWSHNVDTNAQCMGKNSSTFSPQK